MYGERLWDLIDDTWGATPDFWTGYFLFSIGLPAAAPSAFADAGAAPAAVAQPGRADSSFSQTAAAGAAVSQTAVVLP